MRIERITKVKAESLITKIPSLGPALLFTDEDTSFYMITEDGFFSVTFNIAVVDDGAITYISNDGLRGEFEAWLSQNDSL